MNWTDKIQVTCEDNMKLMSRYPDNYFDWAIIDPPYGIDVANDDRFGKKSSKKLQQRQKIIQKNIGI
jgi:site-specific DNA-methyltransferase (adenine-specific)